MQPINAAPRDGMTAGEVERLIRHAPGVRVTHGLELIDQNLELIEDISDDCSGGSVSRNSYNRLHGTAQLAITRDLDWGSAIVRPYYVLFDDQGSARFNLGAYYTSKPVRQTGENPPSHDVTGFDILHALDDPTGTAYAVPAGTDYLTAVETILTDRGYTRYVLDPSAAGKTLADAYVSPLSDDKTWLGIVNDLLAAIGYAGVWSDWDGRLRCEPYLLPRDRPVEWVYDSDVATTLLSPDRAVTRDYYEAPNRWVFIRNEVDGPTPVDGDGVYTYVDESTGIASVEARGGRVVTKPPQRVDAADQAALEARAWVTIDADMRIAQTVACQTFPNPLHWHFDRLALDDPEAGTISRWADVLATGWTLPLDGSDMDQEWTVL